MEYETKIGKYQNNLTNTSAILLKQLKNKYHLQKDNFSGYLKKTIEKSFFISPTTANEVEIQIKCLKNNKASDPNSIPKSIFKNF